MKKMMFMVLMLISFMLVAEEKPCSGSWCEYNDLKSRVENADMKAGDSYQTICSDVEKAIEGVKNPRTVESLRLLAANCWLKGYDYDAAAKITEPFKISENEKLVKFWFNLEKSALDGFVRADKEGSSSRSYEEKQEIIKRCKILLKFNEKLGMQYSDQIKYVITMMQ